MKALLKINEIENGYLVDYHANDGKASQQLCYQWSATNDQRLLMFQDILKHLVMHRDLKVVTTDEAAKLYLLKRANDGPAQTQLPGI